MSQDAVSYTESQPGRLHVRGPYVATDRYFHDNLVFYLGNVWRMKLGNALGYTPPALGTTPSAIWELFATQTAGDGGGTMTGEAIVGAIDDFIGDTSWRDGTNLSIANRGVNTLDIVSSSGTDATIPKATTSLSGLMSAADKTALDDLVAGVTGTDLSIDNRGTDTLDILSSTGTDITLPKATGSLTGLMSATDKAKLDAFSIDTDVTLAANSDTVVASQKAVKSYIDTAVAGAGGTYTNEDAQDAVGGSLLDSLTIDFTYDDAANTITAGIIDASVTYAKLQNVAALSVVGRAGGTSGVSAAITATTDQVLRESGGSLGFGTIATGGIASNAVTDAKLRQGGAKSVIGRSANSTGNVADIAVSGSDQVLRESGGSLGFGTVATGGIADTAVTYAKIQNVSATSRLLGRKTTGAGVVEEIVLDTDGTLAGNSDVVVASQKALKTYIDAAVAGGGGGGSYTDEQAQDAVGGILTDSTTIDFTYDDAGNTITAILKDASVSLAKWATGILDTDGTLAANSDTKVASQKAVKTYADAAAAAATGTYTDEKAQDAVGGILTDSGTIDFTYDDAGNSITAIVIDASITYAKFQNVAGLSVVGRGGGTSGVTAAITASTDQVLRENSGALGFGTIATGGIAANAVTDAKLRQGGAKSVIGRSANSTGNVADIAVSSSDQVLRESGGTLGFGTIATGGIADTAVTYAKIQNVSATSRLLGRKTAGSGVVEEITLDTDGTLAANSDVIVASQKSVKTYVDALATTVSGLGKPTEQLVVSVSDEVTALTTGVAKVTFRFGYAFTITDIRASVSTASTSGLPTIDIKESGTTIFSTKLTIDANEKTSTTAATPCVISDTSIADDAEMTVNVDVAGTGTKGLKILFIGHRT